MIRKRKKEGDRDRESGRLENRNKGERKRKIGIENAKRLEREKRDLLV